MKETIMDICSRYPLVVAVKGNAGFEKVLDIVRLSKTSKFEKESFITLPGYVAVRANNLKDPEILERFIARAKELGNPEFAGAKF